jgi:hypothetical protein
LHRVTVLVTQCARDTRDLDAHNGDLSGWFLWRFIVHYKNDGVTVLLFPPLDADPRGSYHAWLIFLRNVLHLPPGVDQGEIFSCFHSNIADLRREVDSAPPTHRMHAYVLDMSGNWI